MPQGNEQMRYARYVALGDSQTEGLGDGDEIRGYRGWADRLAEHLAAVSPGLCYANLAVRGRRAAQVRDEQLGPALELHPDLATVMAGMNDLIRPGFSAAEVTGCLEEIFTALTAAGAHVVTVTCPGCSTSPRASAPSRPATVSPSSTLSPTPSPPTPGCGAPTGCTQARKGTLASPSQWPTPSACPAVTAHGPNRCPLNPPARPGRPPRANCAGWG